MSFSQREYWIVKALLQSEQGQQFEARLVQAGARFYVSRICKGALSCTSSGILSSTIDKVVTLYSKVAGKSLPKEGLDEEDAAAAVKELQSMPFEVWLLA